jgi:hypothetical protein
MNLAHCVAIYGLDRARRALIVAIALLAIGVQTAMCQSENHLPQMEPQNELMAPSETAFVEECKARISDDAKKFGWIFGNSIVTRSDKWGLIWRVDFFLPGDEKRRGLINRIICWRAANEEGISAAFAFGHNFKRFD